MKEEIIDDLSMNNNEQEQALKKEQKRLWIAIITGIVSVCSLNLLLKSALTPESFYM